MSKDFALGPIKTETTANLLNKKVEMMFELMESGNKPLKK